MRFLSALLILMSISLIGCSTSTSLLREEAVIENAEESGFKLEDDISINYISAKEIGNNGIQGELTENEKKALLDDQIENRTLAFEKDFSSIDNSQNTHEINYSETSKDIEKQTTEESTETNNLIDDNQNKLESEVEEEDNNSFLVVILLLIVLITIKTLNEYRKYTKNIE